MTWDEARSLVLNKNLTVVGSEILDDITGRPILDSYSPIPADSKFVLAFSTAAQTGNDPPIKASESAGYIDCLNRENIRIYRIGDMRATYILSETSDNESHGIPILGGTS